MPDSDLNLAATITSSTNTLSAPANPSNVNDGSDATASVSGAGVSSTSTAPKRIWHSDLGSPFEISTIKLLAGGNNWDWWNGFAAAVGSPTDPGYMWSRVEYSTDNSVWTEVPAARSQASGWITFTLTSVVEAQYWRVYVQGHNGTRYFGGATIYTWQIFGSVTSIPDFVGSPVEGMAPHAVQFTDLSDPPATEWLWTFGDGTTSTEQHPLHVYPRAGVYDVSLSVNGASGASTLVFEDSFERSESDGLGEADTGETWDAAPGNPTIPTEGAVDVTGSDAVFTQNGSGANNYQMYRAIMASPPSFPFDVVTEFTLDSGEASISWLIGEEGCTYESSEDFAYMEASASGVADGGLVAGITGPDILASDNGSFGPALDLATTYKARMRVTETAVYARLWESGDEEPSDWGVDLSEDLDHSVMGIEEIGLWVFDSGGGTPGIGATIHSIEVHQLSPSSLTKVGYITVRSAPVLPYFRDRLLLSVRASFNDEKLYNHSLVVATGNKAQIYYAEVKDEDPDSPTRIEAIGDRVIKLETDLITTQQTANKAAKKLFLDNCLVSEDVAVEAICNPALEGNDVVGLQEMTFSQIERNFRLQSFSVPLSTSRQRLRLARIINLQTQTISVNDDIVLVGVEQKVKSTAGTSDTIDLPAGVEDGDFLLIWVALDEDSGSATPTVSGTWQSISGSNKWKYRFASSEPSSRTVSWSGSRRAVITMLAYRNVATSSPVARLVVSAGPDDKTVTVPGMSLASGEYHLVSGVQADWGNVTYTWPAAWTEQAEGDTGGDTSAHVSVAVADKPFVGANPSSFNVTASAAKGETRYQIALRKDIS